MKRNPIFTDFAPRHAQAWGSETAHLRHSLAQSGLFSDERLAALIEKAPAGTYHVNTMDVATHDPRSRREGMIDDLSGSQTLEAIRRGHIWILVQNPDQFDPDYAEMLDRIYRELHDLVPGFKSFRQKLSILISSPDVQVYYHADVPGQTLWQVRGTKRVYLYPNRPPFLMQEGIERIVLGEAHEISLPYAPSFDSHAEIIDLEPGNMLHWPINCPHRIVNASCLNVSFTTEHWTPQLRNIYAVNYANGILRNRFGCNNLNQPTSGARLYGRMALAGIWKMAGLQRRRRQRFQIDFKVDPSAPYSVRDIPAIQLSR